MIYDNLDSISNYIQQQINTNTNSIFILQGPLGAGKTTLVKEVLNRINKNIKTTSPTYNIIHQYDEHIFHYDLYMKDLEYALNIGILDLLSLDGVHFVEWGDKILFDILKKAGLNTYIINIQDNNNNRLYEVIEG